MGEQELYNYIIDYTKDIINREGILTSRLLFFKNKELEIIIPPYKNDEEKYKWLINTKKRFKKSDINIYWHITSGWKGNNIKIRPSTDPKATRILSIDQYNRNLPNKKTQIDIVKEDDKILFNNEKTIIDKNWITPWDFFAKYDFYKEMEDIQAKEEAKKQATEFVSKIMSDKKCLAKYKEAILKDFNWVISDEEVKTRLIKHYTKKLKNHRLVRK